MALTDKRRTASLDNWKIDRINDRQFRLTGEIRGDSSNHFEDGTVIFTSVIDFIDFDKRYARTKRGSIYWLSE